MIDITTFLDLYTFYHIAGGFVLGILSYLFLKKKMRYALPIALLLLWEIVEQNILVSWIGLLEKEALVNSIFDIIIGSIGVVVGQFFAENVKKNKNVMIVLLVTLIAFFFIVYYKFPELLALI